MNINKLRTSVTSSRCQLPPLADQSFREIVLAGGCFWGLEAYISRLNGVIYTNVGYSNGKTENPTYEQVCYNNTGHAEAVYVQYDPKHISLTTLLTYYFKVVDPTSINKQGNDRGIQYRCGIYYIDSADKTTIDVVIAQEQTKYTAPIVTEVLPLDKYYVAEDYHQNYLDKNPSGYCHINLSSLDNDPIAKRNNNGNAPSSDNGMDITNKSYAKPSQEEIKRKLTDVQYTVTQVNGTEPPFANAYWNNHEPGLYVDIVTGEPLFSSRDKYESGTGWPSFTKPIAQDAVTQKADKSLFIERVEVQSRYGESHLGHVFDDGPQDQGGRRYCVNSAALRFIAFDKMEEYGYGAFKHLVE